MRYTVEDIDENEVEVEVTVTSFSKGYPARTYGDPDDCWEGEDDKVEFEVRDLDGNLLISLPDSQLDKLEEKLIEAHYEAIDDDFDIPEDDAYDDYVGPL